MTVVECHMLSCESNKGGECQAEKILLVGGWPDRMSCTGYVDALANQE